MLVSIGEIELLAMVSALENIHDESSPKLSDRTIRPSTRFARALLLKLGHPMCADIVSPAVRSSMMSRIRGKNSRPELALRRQLFAAGYRFRLHRRDLPGSPDIVLPRYRAVVFVHGCFWHRHPGCPKSTTPSSNATFWATKFASNMRRDAAAIDRLVALGWRVAVVWECALGADGLDPPNFFHLCGWIGQTADQAGADARRNRLEVP